MTNLASTQMRRLLALIALIFAGEVIFSLPFHVARFFRPTLLSVFELSNTGLGDVFAVFGVTATLAYFPGGLLADRFSARKLMTISLIATALGGVYFAQIPSSSGLVVLFAYWGVTSILLFWAAMIKATREWGGEAKQGSAFGLLDGGRGLVAALLASVAVYLLGFLLPANIDGITSAERRYALQNVIYFYSAMTALAGIVVWCLIPDTEKTRNSRGGSSMAELSYVLWNTRIWLQATVVVCAYCAYKGLDNFALYAVDVLYADEVKAARFTSYAAYLRPISAVAAGFLANRICASRVIAIAFMILVASYFLLSLYHVDTSTLGLVYLNIAVTFCAVFALRGVYFALLEESSLDSNKTGAAVGVISLIGFTPDMFFTPLAGRILDAAPGVEGHQNFFSLLIFISLLGMVAVITLRIITRKRAVK